MHFLLEPAYHVLCVFLQVAHVGDALADSAAVDPPGAAGIFVDLFSEGQLIPELTQVTCVDLGRACFVGQPKVLHSKAANNVFGRHLVPARLGHSCMLKMSVAEAHSNHCSAFLGWSLPAAAANPCSLFMRRR